MKNKPLKIYLCDLTHETVILVSDTIPINIGYVGSYAKKIHKDNIDLKLFKYPQSAIDAIKNDPPDILALSNYSWNSFLSERMCGIAKKINPDVVTVMGGTNFPHDPKLQLDFLKQRPNTNFHVELEGEVSFANLISKVIDSKEGKGNLYESPVDGCVFIHPDEKKGLVKNLVKGIKPNRILHLDDIPSPYLNGMLDHFFDGRLSPFIETNRGCPFKCSFCHTGNDYFQKVHMFSLERIKKELEYIAIRAAKQKNTILHLADVNFGMFPRDKDICVTLKELQEKYKWPTTILSTTGKNNKERVIDVTSILGNAFSVTMSVQSMDEKVLKNINRDNIKLDHYKDVNKHLQKSGRSTYGELIIGLPGETKKSFLEGVVKVIDSGVWRLTIYTLMMLYGTEFKDPGYRSKFKMKGKYRVVPLNLGEYDGKKIFDYEEVCIENKDMSFQDYLELRQLALIVESIFNNQPFATFFKYANSLNVSKSNFLFKILTEIHKAPKKIVEIFNNFKDETIGELWDSPDEIIDYYSQEKNYKKLIDGDVGGNLIYKYKSINLATAMSEWIEYLSNLLIDITSDKKNYNNDQVNEINKEIKIISEYHKNRTWKFLDGDLNISKNNISMKSEYDILAWLNNPETKPLSQYKLKKPVDYFFGYTKNQLQERYDVFRRYGTSINALSKIVVRIRPENWLRSVGTNPIIEKDDHSKKRSRTRYAMAN